MFSVVRAEGPPPMPPQPLGPVIDRGASIVALLWVEAMIASIFVAFRFWARSLSRATGLDDWMMLIATVSVIACASIVTWMSALGGFRHVWHIPRANIPTVGLGSYIFQTVSIVGVFTSKFSVGYLLLRIMPAHNQHMRRFIWFLILFTVLHNFVALILNWFTCNPSKKLWNPFMPGTCWPSKAKLGWIYMGMTLNIVADFLLAILPAPMVYSLQLSAHKRLKIYLLMSLSLMATVCAIMKIIHMKNLLHTEDFGWATWELTIWSLSEVFAIIVCGSVAPLKQLFDYFFSKSDFSGSTAYSTTGYSQPGKGYTKASDSTSRKTNGGEYELNSREQIWRHTDLEIAVTQT